jgi:hypothetical protein
LAIIILQGGVKYAGFFGLIQRKTAALGGLVQPFVPPDRLQLVVFRSLVMSKKERLNNL